MITVQTLMNRLAFGPLKNTSVVDTNDKGEVNPEYYDQLIDLINEGLRDICTKQVIFKSSLTIEFQTDQRDYELVESGVGTYLNTDDEDDLNDDTFLRPITVYALTSEGEEGREFSINAGQGIKTTRFNILRFSQDFMDNYTYGVRVYYQYNHVMMEGIGGEINLPPNLEYPLQLFVAASYISQMNGPEHVRRGDALMAKYLQEMGSDVATNLSSLSEIEVDNRFTDRGFV